MTITIKDAELLVTAPDSSASIADFAVPAEHIMAVQHRERAGRDVSKGSIQINNSDGRYTTGANQIDVDDEIEWRVGWEGAGVASDFGEVPFGSEPFGSEYTTVATLVCTNWSVTLPPRTSVLSLEIEDFVFNRLASQHVSITEEDIEISGSSDALLNTVLDDEYTSIGTSQLPTITETVNYSADEKKGHKVVDEIARYAHVKTGDSWILGSDRTDLTMQKVGDLASQWTADDDFMGGIEHASDADELVNEVRVEGGIDDEENIDQEQTTGGSFVTVTDTNRLTYQLTPRKPEVSKVHLWLRHVTGSSDEIEIRLQSDSGGSPIAIGDTDSDLTSNTKPVPDGFDGEMHIRLGDHVLGPSDQPHLIIEATGSDGVDVETDGTGNPRFHSHFPKPVIVRVPENTSQADYRTHEKTIEDDSLVTFDSARDRADAELDRNAFPNLKFGPAEADSRRAHELDVADVVTFAYPTIRAEGDYITTEVGHAYSGSTLDTEIALKSVARFA